MKNTFLFFVLLLKLSSALAQTAPRLLVPYRSGNKWGYSDTLGQIKIQPKYDSVALFDYNSLTNDNHVLSIVQLNGKKTVINERGTVIVPASYDAVEIDWLDGLAFIVTKNKKQTIFKNGRELFPAVYDQILPTQSKTYRVRKNNRWGMINTSGKVLIPAIYDQVTGKYQYNPGIDTWEATKNGTSKLYNFKKADGEFEEPPPMEVLTASDIPMESNSTEGTDSLKKELQVDSIHLGYKSGIVYKDGRQGVLLIDEAKLYFFSKTYDIRHVHYFPGYARSFLKEGAFAYILARLNGKYGMIDQNEHEILPFVYDMIEEKDNFFVLTKNHKLGFFIPHTIYPVIQPGYDQFLSVSYLDVNDNWSFSLFKVVKNGKVGYVGENGISFFKN
jgi:hypothetical protein